MSNDLIVGEDLGAVTDNLQQLITKPPRSRMLTLRTTVGMALGDIPDERSLTGFAKLSLHSLGPVYGAPALDPDHIDVFGRSPLD